MTLCYVNRGHCQCQPDEGVECPYLPKEAQVELAALRRELSASAATIEQLSAELQSACDIGLAFSGSMFPDHPVRDECVKRFEARLRALSAALRETKQPADLDGGSK